MVLDDQTRENNNTVVSKVTTSKVANLNPASPFDRLAAFIVDTFIVVSPVLALFLAPLMRQMNLSAQMSDYLSTGEQLFYMIIIGFLGVVLYNSLALSFFGTTLGKKIFKLQVVNIWTHSRPSFLACFFREVIKVFQVISFFPLFLLISTKQRRLLHDRVVEVAVITSKTKGYYPHPIEISFARGFYYGLFVLLMLLIVVPLLQSKKKNSVSLSEVLGEDLKCAEVTEQVRTDKIVKAKNLNRVELALSLYLTDAITDSCFVKEVNNVTGVFNKNDLYLAKLIFRSTSSEDSDLFTEYSSAICRGDIKSESCQLANIVSKRDVVIPESFAPQGLVARTWALKHKLQNNDFNKIEKYSIDQWPISKMGSFLSEAKVKTLWSQKKYEQAEFALQNIAPMLTAKNRDALTGWSCFQGLLKSCESINNYSCKTYSEVSEQGFSDVEMTDFDILVQAQKGTCKGSPPVKRAQSHNSLPIKKLVLGMNQYDSPGADGTVLMQLFNDSLASITVRDYALLRLMQKSNPSKEVINYVLKNWKQAPRSMLWESIGEKLSRHYYRAGAYILSSRVIKTLEEYRPLSPRIRQQAVISYYKSKQLDAAWSLYSKYFNTELDSRRPASAKEFDGIRKTLIKRFSR